MRKGSWNALSLCLMGLLGVGLVLLNDGRAYASVNLPLHHWAYEAIERLTALGVIDRAMVASKPYSRKQAAQYVARALDRIRSGEVHGDGREVVAEPLLDRLMRELRPELAGLGALGQPPHRPSPPHPSVPPHPSLSPSQGERSKERGERNRGIGREWMSGIRYGGRVTTEADAFSVGGGQTVRFRENRGGEYYANGIQNQTDVRGWIEVGDWASLMAQPKFISNRHALGIGATNNSHNFYLREFSLKFTAYNVTAEVGRGTLWWGPGYHGSLLLTDHAFPLDMIKLGSEEPFRLPWVFRSLGEWKVNSFLAQLEKDRDFSRAKVFGLRVNYLPTNWLEVGATRLTQFGGRGRDQSFPETVFKTYGNPPNQSGAAETNEQFMLDIRAKIPAVSYLVPFPSGVQLYGELGSEDKWSKIPIPSRAAVLGGIYIPQVFSGDTMDLRIEYADTDLTRRKTGIPEVWYNNGTYVSGLRHRGFPLGHHMGTDAIDVFVRSTRYLTDDVQLGTNLNFQERGRSQANFEQKREVAFDLSWWLSARTQFQVGYTFQRIKNPGQITNINPFVETFAAGVTATNHLLSTSLAVEF